MKWDVELHPAFYKEFSGFTEDVQNQVFVKAKILEEYGPQLARPHVDTLEGSRHNNMKELRFDADSGVWRLAFAFDPKRKAILLVAGDKKGANQKKFYKGLIKTADKRFDEHLKGKNDDE